MSVHRYRMREPFYWQDRLWKTDGNIDFVEVDVETLGVPPCAFEPLDPSSPHETPPFGYNGLHIPYREPEPEGHATMKAIQEELIEQESKSFFVDAAKPETMKARTR